MGLQFFFPSVVHFFFPSVVHSEHSRVVLKLGAGVLLGLGAQIVLAQDVKLNVTYVCNGERVYVESCNIRDLSDTSTCMVAHPDRPQHNGFMAYTTETRGTLKKLFPTCKQPSAEELARAEAFKKKQAEIYAANVARASGQGSGQANSSSAQSSQANVSAGQIAPPKNAEEREIRRCVSSGRLPATCTGNELLGAFGQMLGSVAPALDTTHPKPGPEMAGVYLGAGNWRLDFIDGGVMVNCAYLSPDQHSYRLDFKSDRTLLTVDTTPRPLVLTLRADGTMVGQGPFVLDGVVATGVANEGPDPNASSGLTDQYGMSLSNSQAASRAEVYKNGQAYYGAKGGSGTPHSTFAHKRVTCPALNLSSKGGAVGVQTMQTNLLKSMFSDGDTGPPTPAGIRMHGIFAAETGFSVEFFPESAIVGCGPDVARAYPYTVEAGASGATIRINAPDRPLVLAFRANGELKPSSAGAYLVHGRITTGQDDDGNFTFSPMEQSCNLAVLAPSKVIPASGGSASVRGSVAGTAGAAMATPGAPTGTAVLLLVSGLPAQAGTANVLAGHPYILLRDNIATVMAQAGVNVPAGMSPYKYLGMACGQHTPECPKIIAAVQADTASAARADAGGKGTMPGVPAGTYYLMISTRYNNQALVWDEAVELKAGENSMALDLRNGRVVN
jgi:hypothetical protein